MFSFIPSTVFLLCNKTNQKIFRVQQRVDNCLNHVMCMGDFSLEEPFCFYELKTVANRMVRMIRVLKSITKVMTDKIS